MADETEKPLKPAEMRKAFHGVLERLKSVEDGLDALPARVSWDQLAGRVKALEDEIRGTKDFFDQLNRKIDRYSLELDQAMPRITHADAELMRAARQIDMILRLVGENAHGVGKIMERMNERTGETGSEDA